MVESVPLRAEDDAGVAQLNSDVMRSQRSVGRLIAGVFAIAAFVVSLISGLQAGNSTMRIVTVALMAMVVCHVLGSILGFVIEGVIAGYNETLKPVSDSSATADEVAAAEVEIVEDEAVQQAA